MTTICRIDAAGLVPIPPSVVEVLTFAGGEPHVNLHNEAEIAGRSFLLFVQANGFGALGECLVINDALRRAGGRVSLFCPYLPGARQDRGAPLTAKVFADVINLAGFERVYCVDPHSDVMPALLDRVTVIGIADVVDPRMLAGQNLVLVCPDAGATKRTEQVAERFGLPVVYARKHRNPKTGGLSGFACEEIARDAVALVIDDICDGGGTFLGLAAALKHPREQTRLWTSHGIYSRGMADLRGSFSLIGCTDSFPSFETPDVKNSLLPLLASHPLFLRYGQGGLV